MFNIFLNKRLKSTNNLSIIYVQLEVRGVINIRFKKNYEIQENLVKEKKNN